MIKITKCILKHTPTNGSSTLPKLPLHMQTKIGTIEYTPSNNSTFANYPVSGKFRIREISGFLAE